MSQPLQNVDSVMHPAQDIGADNTSEVSQEQQLEYLVDVFHDFLLDTVDISALQSVIQELERHNQLKDATDKLIEYIKKSKEPGKWRAFFDGLHSIGNSIVVETVLQEKPDSKWHDARKELIKLFAGRIEETLKLDCILPYCLNLLPDGSIEKIHELCEELENKREASEFEEIAPREHTIGERGRNTASLTQHGQENPMATQAEASRSKGEQPQVPMLYECYAGGCFP
ncbi:hypothetical protein C0Q70_18613 [Pomacea canaliculata]|uniref:Uncharacterized protein n=1 Tax=Pomacea canaliculata TaxID=400727 RepID=A0A2T7NH00_POMCA|nr:hypothetical protein C0Q70_18613 [Pomacea canaliculata]